MSVAPVVERVLGRQATLSPFVAERIAIDATNGLRAAEVGLRAFRRRPLLRRLWDGATGGGQRLQAAIGSDLLAVQSTTVALVRQVMAEESRTQHCVELVVHNLCAVNEDLDEQVHRTDALMELHAVLRESARLLAEEVAAVSRRIGRLEALRRLDALFLAGDLHAGTGPLLGAALYLASIVRHFAHESAAFRDDEWGAALANVKHCTGSAPEPVPDLVWRAVAEPSDSSAEVVAYLTAGTDGPVASACATLAERRLAGVRADRPVAEEAVAVVRALRDPDGGLRLRLLRPWEFSERLAREMLADGAGGRP